MHRAQMIFIDKVVSEEDILNILNEYLGLDCESLDYPKEHSEYFVTYDTHTKGIKISIFISWSLESKHPIDCMKLCRYLALKLKTRVVFESYKIIESTTEYIFFDTDGQLYSVEIIEEYDGDDFLGVSVIENSKRSLSLPQSF